MKGDYYIMMVKTLSENESYPRTVPVPVIVSFDSKGEMVPLYFRYNNLKLKIDNVKAKYKGMGRLEKFDCEITLTDRIQIVELYYFSPKHSWGLKFK